MYYTHNDIDKATQYRDRTGKCPVCKKKPSSEWGGVTCGDEACMRSWIFGKKDPCVGLVNYGIQSYDCDVVVHVCWRTSEMFAYSLEWGLHAIQNRKYPKVASHQDVNGERVRTAGGYLVPCEDVPGCVDIPWDILAEFPIRHNDNTSKKGHQAALITQACLIRGIFPRSFVRPSEVTNLDAQLRGQDIVLSPQIGPIQVKCDLPGGSKDRGGSGNLFLQVCEINPNKLY